MVLFILNSIFWITAQAFGGACGLTGLSSPQEIESISKQVRSQMLCPELMSKEEVTDLSSPVPPLSAEKRLEIAKNLAQIVIAPPDSKFDKENGTVSIHHGKNGTGFAVRTSAGISWLTAAHVTTSIKKGDQIFLFPSANNDEGRVVLTSKDLFVGQVSLSKYQENEFAEYTDKGTGSDFASFPNSGMQYIGEEQVQKIKGLEVRDLGKMPLKMNEPIYFAGYQADGVPQFFNCSFRGLSMKLYNSDFNFRIRAKCDNKSTNLGGISGGAFVDKEGRVVSIFNGFEGVAPNYISATPVFVHPGNTNSLRPYPVMKDVKKDHFLCLPCYDDEPSGSDEKFLSNIDALRRACVLSYDAKNKKIRYLNAR